MSSEARLLYDAVRDAPVCRSTRDTPLAQRTTSGRTLPLAGRTEIHAARRHTYVSTSGSTGHRLACSFPSSAHRTRPSPPVRPARSGTRTTIQRSEAQARTCGTRKHRLTATCTGALEVDAPASTFRSRAVGSDAAHAQLVALAQPCRLRVYTFVRSQCLDSKRGRAGAKCQREARPA